MKRLTRLLCSACAVLLAVAGHASPFDDLVPRPRYVAPADGFAPADAPISRVKAAVPQAKGRATDAESYRIVIRPSGVKLTAPTAEGLRYAETTLEQLRKLAGGRLPCGTVIDWPAFRYRGFMLDVGRNWQPVENIREILDFMAAYKLNLFHWHLTDYWGWRLESKRVPELNTDAATIRNVGKRYTQAEFLAVVDYAAARGITVLPEFDVPGHTQAFRNALGIETMRDPKADRALKAFFDEFVELVPAEKMPYIHLGTDEVRNEPEKVDPDVVRTWAKHAAAKGHTIVGWAPGIDLAKAGIKSAKMQWGSKDESEGFPFLDMTSRYIDVIDPMQMLGMAAYAKPCPWKVSGGQALGALIGCWHDDLLTTPDQLFTNNAVFPAIVANADAFWCGRPKDHAASRTRLPLPSDPAFGLAVDLERRVIAQRDRVLGAGFRRPFAFLAQTPMRWRLSYADGTVIATDVPQATIVLHQKGEAENLCPKTNATVVAETWIRSEKNQTVGAWIGFTGFSRSSGRSIDSPLPGRGQWNRHGATVELNGERLAPPDWVNAGLRTTAEEMKVPHFWSFAALSNKIPWTNEEYYMRQPMLIRLKAGWNHVKLTMPSPDPEPYACRHAWCMTFVPLLGTSAHPREVPGLEYRSTPPASVTRRTEVLPLRAESLPSLVTGGERVTGWTVDAKGWWHVKLPAGMKCSQLFVNGQRRVRPHVPRQGWFYMDERPEGESGRERQLFRAREGQIDPSWTLKGAEACVVHAWNMTRTPIDAYDPATRVVTCSCASPRKGYMSFGPDRWYRLENVKEALGEPGDWYLEEDGALTYVPKAGEDPSAAEVWAAVREHALVIEGQTNVVIRGKIFAYAGWTVGKEGQTFPQAGANLPAAVLVRNSKGVRFENCVFKHTGGWGLEFGPGAVDCSAVGCEFYDLGAGGVKIGCAWEGMDDPANWASGCRVEDCLVAHGGRVEPAGVGLWIGNANHCVLSHNTIRDMHYSGISVGWMWDRKPSGAHHNLVEFNDISDIGQKRLMDMGGIYTLGLQPGTEIVGNVIRGVSVTRGSGFGLYFDQGTAFVTARSNYVERCEGGNFFVQFNTASNVVEDNAFVCGKEYMLRHAISPAHDHETRPTRFARNVIWWDDPDTGFCSADPLGTNYIVATDNTCFLKGLPLTPKTPGVDCRGLPRPQPFCVAGRRIVTEVTASLPEVPHVFDVCPPQTLLGNTTGAVLSNAHVAVTLDAKGVVTSVRETLSGRERLVCSVPFVTLKMADGRLLAPESLTSEDGKYLRFVFPGDVGECWMKVDASAGGLTFETIKTSLQGAVGVTLACLAFDPALSDDADALRFRVLSEGLEVKDVDGEMSVWVSRPYGYLHKRFILTVGR